MSDIVLTPEQQRAVSYGVKHFLEPKRPTFAIGGLAGVGKTTIIKAIIAEVTSRMCKVCKGVGVVPDYPVGGPLSGEASAVNKQCTTCKGTGYNRFPYRVATCAFTGKAVSVLRSKGLDSSVTMHKLMYNPMKDEDGKVVWRRRYALDDVDFVIVDEASMVSTELNNDLLSYKKQVLYVGDIGQLEPVGNDPRLMRNPDITLEQIHRQAAGNPIIRYALDLRHDKQWDDGEYDGKLVVTRQRPNDEELLTYTQIICAYNKDRTAMNARIRQLKNLTGIIELGEKVICLKNDSKLGIFNGQIMFVTKIRSEDTRCINCDLVDESGEHYYDIPILRAGMQGQFDPKKQELPKGTALFDYGYCLTCHKSQGSEWERVLVIEQYAPPKLWQMSRWSYTAATRAKDFLKYVKCR